MALVLAALMAGAATAQRFMGTNGSDTIFGTDEPDRIRAQGNNDYVYGRGDDDSLLGEYGDDAIRGNMGDDIIKGGEGADLIIPCHGADEAYGEKGNDEIRMVNDPQRDFVNCGENVGGKDVDTARVAWNDLIDGRLAGNLTTTEGLTCERVFVDGEELPHQ